MIYFAVIIIAVISFYITKKTITAFSSFLSKEEKKGKETVYKNFPKIKKPLGGGVAILLTLLAANIILFILFLFKIISVNDLVFTLVFTFVVVVYSLIGFIDDYRKVTTGKGAGEKLKLVLQIAAALGLAIVIAFYRGASLSADGADVTKVVVPFVTGDINFGWIFVIFVALVLTASSNAVNLTDGVDGLAGSSILITLLAYFALTFIKGYNNIPAFFPILIIACIAGFLWYNHPRAKIIMGDTGALGLGSGIGAIALLSGTEWLLIAFAAPFIIDTLSVIIQVGVIKFFRGPVRLLRHGNTEVGRPFLCTPLHHHFQSLNWNVWQILALFIISGILSSGFALIAAYTGQHSWWLFSVLIPAAILIFAAMQKIVRANYFLGIDRVNNCLEIYKGLPVILFGKKMYSLERSFKEITDYMVQNIAADGLLWRNSTEIEAHINIGKIMYEYKLFDLAAKEWQQVPERNFLLRHNIVVKLGKIYYQHDDLLSAIRIWQKLPSRVISEQGLNDTIKQAKIRLSQLADKFYTASIVQARSVDRYNSATRLNEVISMIEQAVTLNGDLQELIKDEGIYFATDEELRLFQATKIELSGKRDDLHKALIDVKEVESVTIAISSSEEDLLKSFSGELAITASELLRLVDTADFQIFSYQKIDTQSRNLSYQVSTNLGDMVFKLFSDNRITFFMACYNRERGVLKILNDTNAKIPKFYGGMSTSDKAILAISDVGRITVADAVTNGGSKNDLLRKSIHSLTDLKIATLPITSFLADEIAKVLKEKLTTEYYVNALSIALSRLKEVQGQKFSENDKNKLRVVSAPLIGKLIAANSGFIHFEYVPKNLVLGNDYKQVNIIDFEQATIGPYAFDLATLLYNPVMNLKEDEVEEFFGLYNSIMQNVNFTDRLVLKKEDISYAAIVKLIIYGGSAANFFKKFNDRGRLDDARWYINKAEELLEVSDYRNFYQFIKELYLF